MNTLFIGIPSQDIQDFFLKRKSFNNSLTFTANTDNVTIQMLHMNGDIQSSTWNISLEGNTNHEEWKEWKGSTITLKKNEIFSLHALKDNVTISQNTNSDAAGQYQFVINGEVTVQGDVQWLLSKNELKTSVPNYCFYKLFKNCTGLLNTPKYSATTLGIGCYSQMFMGCTQLNTVSELPAMTAVESCYSQMFYGCTSLAYAPELQATIIAKNCYYGMFQGCILLKDAPELPAEQLYSLCYAYMFKDCINLSSIDVHKCLMYNAYDDETSYATVGWTENVAEHGTFHCDELFPYEYNTDTDFSRVPIGWELNVENYSGPLCFTAKQANSTLMIKINGSYAVPIQVDYSTDYISWQPYTIGTTLTMQNIDDKIYFKSRVNSYGIYNNFNGDSCHQFVMTGQIEASGNLSYLITKYGHGYKVSNSYDFQKMFQNCSSLLTAPDIHFIQVNSKYAFHSTFENCTNLKSIKKIRFKGTLYGSCCSDMFNNCTNLETVPLSLDATTLYPMAYQSMFEGCKKLTISPKIMATKLVQTNDGNNGWHFAYMFSRCSSLSVASDLNTIEDFGENNNDNDRMFGWMYNYCISLKTIPKLPNVKKLNKWCYIGMFSNCSNLSGSFIIDDGIELGYGSLNQMFYGTNVIPQLPNIEKLTSGCFGGFYAGTNIISAPELPYTELADGCYCYMFAHCQKLTNAPKLPATQLCSECYKWMFRECTSISNVIELSALQFDSQCCQYMFYDAKNVNVKVHFTQWPDSSINATHSWMYNTTGKFICPTTLPITTRSSDTVPNTMSIERF